MIGSSTDASCVLSASPLDPCDVSPLLLHTPPLPRSTTKPTLTSIIPILPTTTCLLSPTALIAPSSSLLQMFTRALTQLPITTPPPLTHLRILLLLINKKRIGHPFFPVHLLSSMSAALNRTIQDVNGFNRSRSGDRGRRVATAAGCPACELGSSRSRTKETREGAKFRGMRTATLYYN
jgi:hypothetical protein